LEGVPFPHHTNSASCILLAWTGTEKRCMASSWFVRPTFGLPLSLRPLTVRRYISLPMDRLPAPFLSSVGLAFLFANGCKHDPGVAPPSSLNFLLTPFAFNLVLLCSSFPRFPVVLVGGKGGHFAVFPLRARLLPTGFGCLSQMMKAFPLFPPRCIRSFP